MFFKTHICFINWVENAFLKQNAPSSTLITMFCGKYSFQKLTQISYGSNVLDDLASNTEDVPWRDTCVSSTQLNRPSCSKQPISTLNIWFQEVFLSKTNSIPTGKQMLDVGVKNRCLFFWEIHVFLQLSWIYLFGVNRVYLHLEIPKLEEVFLSKTTLFSQGQCSRCSWF
jgi:hypothetical protein